MKKPLVVLAGPTAVGKTELSISLAKSINGEIISCDSMQIYKYMDIGSAKISKEEMDGVPHFLIDLLDPKDEFNVVIFKEMVTSALEEIYARNHIPILVGGTGFYIQAITRDIDFTEDNSDSSIRMELEKYLASHGRSALHDKLREVDPVSANQIHENNTKRVIRAIEYYRMHGHPISEHNEMQREKTSPYDLHYFVLTDERSHLYDRIDRRVDLMIEEGLVSEVESLKEMGLDRSYVSMQGLGYKEILSYLDGEITLDQAIYLVKRDTRHFAKRQLTWFRRESDVIWIDKEKFHYANDEILKYMIEEIQGE